MEGNLVSEVAGTVVKDTWRIRDIFYALLFYFLLHIVEGVVIGILGELRLTPLLHVGIWYPLALFFLSPLVTFGIALYVVRRRYGAPPQEIGFYTHSPVLDPFLGLAGGVGLFLLVSVLDALLERYLGLRSSMDPELARLMLSPDAGGLWGVFMSLCIFAPVAEETFFRGMVYGILRRYGGVGVSTVIASGLFMFVHVNPAVFIQIFVIAVAFSLLYEYRRSLIPSMVAHAVYNFLVFVGVALSSSV